MSDWKETCAKCMDGDIEPRHCEYYGEPNGCNSPSYGQHPTTEKSSAVGNATALREAIEPWVAFGEWLLENAGKEGLGAAIREYGPIIRQRLEELRAVLAKPPRNCDVGTAEEQISRWNAYCNEGKARCLVHGKRRFINCTVCFADWSQMPNVADREGVAS